MATGVLHHVDVIKSSLRNAYCTTVYWAIMSVTQDSQAQEPNFGGNLSLAEELRQPGGGGFGLPAS